MQSFSPLPTSDVMKDTLPKIDDNIKTVMSRSSGVAFPTTNLQVGMQCYRTDLGLTYALTSTGPDVWKQEAAGAKGGGNDQIFYENSKTVTTDFTIPADKNMMSAGPIEIATGVTVAIAIGGEWSIV
jgi:hypothetical protein